MKPDINIDLDGLRGRVSFFADRALMARSAARISQVMVYRRPFELSEALTEGREIEAALVLRDNLLEFQRVFTKVSLEEQAFIEEMGTLDFMIVVDEQADENVVIHELSHVLYYHDDEYRKTVDALWNALSEGKKLLQSEDLDSLGYRECEYADEWFAHLLYGGIYLVELVLEDMPEAMEFYNQTKRMLEATLTVAQSGIDEGSQP